MHVPNEDIHFFPYLFGGPYRPGMRLHDSSTLISLTEKEYCLLRRMAEQNDDVFVDGRLVDLVMFSDIPDEMKAVATGSIHSKEYLDMSKSLIEEFDPESQTMWILGNPHYLQHLQAMMKAAYRKKFSFRYHNIPLIGETAIYRLITCSCNGLVRYTIEPIKNEEVVILN